jgi:molybdate transport system ATP-binding protein
MSLAFSLSGQVGSCRLQAQAQLAANGVTVLFGPSGSGKSTLLRMLAGLQDCDGEIRFGDQLWQTDDVTLPPWQRPLGMMFQEPTLFRHLSVRGNLDYVVKRRGAAGDLDSVVSQARIEDLLGRSVETLSGGEAQRVALARALLAGPQLLLLDEPLSALDHGHKQELLKMISDIARKVPVIYVTHDLDELLTLSRQVWLMEQGRIVARGKAHEELARLDGPLAQRGDATALLYGELGDYDNRDHLQAVTVAQQTFWLPAAQPVSGEEPLWYSWLWGISVCSPASPAAPPGSLRCSPVRGFMRR